MPPLSPIRGAIFDLDGTLLDTVADIAAAANQALASQGLPTHETAAYRRFVGHGSMELMRRASAAGLGIEPESSDQARIVELESLFQAAYEDHWNQRTRPYPGIENLLDVLADRRIPMAVLSNKPHRFTVKCVAQLLARWSFSPVLGQRSDVPKKPDPGAASDIARSWGIPPAQLALVGDTTVDLATGTAAGMRTFGVLWGFHERSRLAPFGLPLAADAEQLQALLGL